VLGHIIGAIWYFKVFSSQFLGVSKRNGSKCYWIKKQIEPFCIQPSIIFISTPRWFSTTTFTEFEVWMRNGSKCYWIKKQIEPFHIHPLIIIIIVQPPLKILVRKVPKCHYLWSFLSLVWPKNTIQYGDCCYKVLKVKCHNC